MNLMVRRILDFVNPRTCVVCGHELALREDTICMACNWQLPRTGYARSPYENPMAKRFYGQFPVERVAGWFHYVAKDPVVRLIHRAKYSGDRGLCVWLGQAAAREFAEHDFFRDVDVILPTPLTRWRRWRRGYNQCEYIARGVAAVTGLPIVTNAVRRVRFAKSQTLLHGDERVQNVKNSFELMRVEALRGKHILLIDDVITTGATVSSCGREIAKAGGVKISVMSIGVTKD